MKRKWQVTFVRMREGLELLPSIYVYWGDNSFWIYASFLVWAVNLNILDYDLGI